MLIKTIDQLSTLTVSELKAICKANNVKGYSTLRKTDLIQFTYDSQPTSFDTPIQYIYNDSLQMYSIVNLDYINLSIKDMTTLLKQHAQGKKFSNQAMNEKEVKALYRAGFRVRHHETLSESEVLEMFNQAHSIQMVANTTQYNIISEVVEVETVATETTPEATYTVGRESFQSYEEALQYCELWNIHPQMIYCESDEQTNQTQETTQHDTQKDTSNEYYTVGNRTFSTYSEAVQYCNDNDFDSTLMIQTNTRKVINLEKQPKKLYTYAYTLRGFSLGCQPSNFISHDDTIGRHGTITYNRQLTQKELNNYELIPFEYDTVSQVI